MPVTIVEQPSVEVCRARKTRGRQVGYTSVLKHVTDSLRTSNVVWYIIIEGNVLPEAVLSLVVDLLCLWSHTLMNEAAKQRNYITGTGEVLSNNNTS